MPYFCVAKVTRALNSHGKALQGAKALVLGVAYKADIDDLRESPALKIIRQLDKQGAAVDYHDPFVAELPAFGMHSVDLTKGAGISAYDVVVDRDGPLRHRLRRRRRARRSSWSTCATPPPASTATARSGSSERRPRAAGVGPSKDGDQVRER